MEQIAHLGDKRMLDRCVYCGGPDQTRDHVPSRVLLDDPFPKNLPVVPACTECNEGFSKDEEYVACLVDCALAGSCDPSKVGRAKVAKILEGRPALAQRIMAKRNEAELGGLFEPEVDRLRNIVLKLARGHAAFDLGDPQYDEPDQLTFCPIPLMSKSELDEFEDPPMFALWPEVGSRAMQRIFRGRRDGFSWLQVQPERYRYLVSVSTRGYSIRIVLSEYLACKVLWP